jgi:hypothetical protein
MHVEHGDFLSAWAARVAARQAAAVLTLMADQRVPVEDVPRRLSFLLDHILCDEGQALIRGARPANHGARGRLLQLEKGGQPPTD